MRKVIVTLVILISSFTLSWSQCGHWFTGGAFSVSESCNSGNYNYTISIVEDANGRIGFQNLYDISQNDTIWANVNCSNKTFALQNNQPLSGYNGVLVQNGSGNRTGSLITINYLVIDAFSNQDNCTATFLGPLVSVLPPQEMKILIYPNPARNKIRIDFEGDAELSLFDMEGARKMVSVQKESGGFVVFIADLAAGMYLMQLEGEYRSHSAYFVKE